MVIQRTQLTKKKTSKRDSPDGPACALRRRQAAKGNRPKKARNRASGAATSTYTLATGSSMCNGRKTQSHTPTGRNLWCRLARKVQIQSNASDPATAVWIRGAEAAEA